MIKTIATTALALGLALGAAGSAHADGAGPTAQTRYTQTGAGYCVKQHRHELFVDGAGVHWSRWRTVSTKLATCPAP